jgi:macrophage erythroblast attacher
MSQKNIERELGAVQASANELAKRGKAGGDSLNKQDAVKAIDGMIGRVENLKRKVRYRLSSGASHAQFVLRG